MTDTYKQRTLQQTRDWVNGRSIHNTIDNECCPDFSCCFPELFITDRDKRMEKSIAFTKRFNLPDILDA